MKTQNKAISQDGSAGEFFRQGAHVTPVNAAAVAAKSHACAFGLAMTKDMADTRRQCSIGCGPDCMQQEIRLTGHIKEGTA